MTKRKTFPYSDYKDDPKHTFLNLAGRSVADDEYSHYRVKAGSYIHIACGDEDDRHGERYIQVDSLMKVAKTALFGVEAAPSLKKVEATFEIAGNHCTIGIATTGERLFLCEGKHGDLFAPIP